MMPGAMHSVDVEMANPGNAVVQCRVADHISAGERGKLQGVQRGSGARGRGRPHIGRWWAVQSPLRMPSLGARWSQLPAQGLCPPRCLSWGCPDPDPALLLLY